MKLSDSELDLILEAVENELGRTQNRLEECYEKSCAPETMIYLDAKSEMLEKLMPKLDEELRRRTKKYITQR